MKWSEIGGQDCSVARALSVVGDRWTILVLREAFLRTRRFEDFQIHTGAPRAVLTERLRSLVDEGVLERVPYSDHAERFEYRLTEMGRDLYPVVVSLLRWGDRWRNPDSEPPVELRHRGCGEVMLPELACPECGEWLEARDVEVSRGPARPDRAGALRG